MFEKNINSYENNNDENIGDVIMALFDLSQLLYEHFRKKCIILVDEYDNPINFSFENLNED